MGSSKECHSQDEEAGKILRDGQTHLVNFVLFMIFDAGKKI